MNDQDEIKRLTASVLLVLQELRDIKYEVVQIRKSLKKGDDVGKPSI